MLSKLEGTWLVLVGLSDFQFEMACKASMITCCQWILLQRFTDIWNNIFFYFFFPDHLYQLLCPLESSNGWLNDWESSRHDAYLWYSTGRGPRSITIYLCEQELPRSCLVESRNVSWRDRGTVDAWKRFPSSHRRVDSEDIVPAGRTSFFISIM